MRCLRRAHREGAVGDGGHCLRVHQQEARSISRQVLLHLGRREARAAVVACRTGLLASILTRSWRPRTTIRSSTEAPRCAPSGQSSRVSPIQMPPYLIRGESGVGKDLVAKAIHAASSRRRGPFVKVNCAAIPQGLLESEFFGHEKGAFTGAHRRKPGQFECANQGTIYLDEL